MLEVKFSEDPLFVTKSCSSSIILNVYSQVLVLWFMFIFLHQRQMLKLRM